MIVCNTYIFPYLLKNNYFPPANTIYQIKVDKAPVCVIIERKQKFDYQAYKFSQSKEFSKAYDLYNKAISIEPNNLDILLNFTKYLISNNNWTGAQNVIDYVLSLYPNNQDALNLNGVICKNTNQVPKAIGLFQYIIQNINPDYFQAYYNLGNCFLLNKDYDKALAYFEKCIEINREYKNAYLNKAHVLMIQHRTEEAKKIMEIANTI
jgi:tetratricopeptide (TPR) repeat protein